MNNSMVENALETYADMVYKLALSQTKNKSSAEDIFQDVFMRLMKCQTKFESKEHMKAWLIKTTVNCCKTLWNSAWFRHTTPLEENLSTETVYQDDCLLKCVQELPNKYSTVIHLFYYEDMSISDISKTLALKKQTVASQLSRGRMILRKKLGGNYSYE